VLTDYTYNPINLRLTQQKVIKKQDDYVYVPINFYGQAVPTQVSPFLGSTKIDSLLTTYAYDSIGNITAMNIISSLPNFSANQTFKYDTANQLIEAKANNGNLYNVTMKYDNYGRINTCNSTHKNPVTNVTQTQNNSYVYNIANPQSTVFAPESANNGNISFTFGVNGSMRTRKDSLANKTEYYLFNAFDQMKAYSNNGEIFAHYGYDDGGQRMYKIVFSVDENWSNTLGGKVLQTDELMLYPNGYININQHGEYTKHYYADAVRIASKIGNEFNSSINYITDTMPLFIMKTELGELTNETVAYIEHNFNPITTLQGDSHENYEDALFFYHGNHLSSVSMVTDITGSVTQQILYEPWGMPIVEYNQYWHQDKVPNFQFSGKILDEESNMLYYEARYLKPPTFISPDPLFEKYPWISRYAYCANNPIRYIDPTGMDIEIALEIRKNKDDKVGQTVIYRDGELYNHDGSKYEGNSEYARAVQKDLNDLKAKDEDLKAIIAKLEEPGKVHTISKVESSPLRNTCEPISKEDASTKGVGSGTNIIYNPDNHRDLEYSTEGNPIYRPAKVGLSNELGHAWYAHMGKADFNTAVKEGNIEVSRFEIQALNVENIAREAYKVPVSQNEKRVYVGGYLKR